jgi:undecaprenyl diphosphate synthase
MPCCVHSGSLFDNSRPCPYNWRMRENFKDFIEPGSEEDKLLDLLDFARLPRHIAVIMDGNGRWAKLRNLPREEGHKAGANSVQEVVETCARLGIKYLTLYAFSKENWKRPKAEISMLWKLLENYLKKEHKVLVKNQLCLKVIGQKDDLPFAVRRELSRVENLTKDFKRMTIVLALNYGGRAEIVEAVKKLCKDNSSDFESLDEKKFAKYLFTSDIPDPDLLIRTSGEMRISNFLLWQIAYSEIWITADYWPDFRKKHLLQALVDFQKRERRFGDIHPH